MMAHYRDEGVVLRTYPLGEADRIVVMATRDHGKVRAVAKGVRRTKSRIGGRLEPLNWVSLLLWAGRNLDTVAQAEVVDAFPAVRADLDKLAGASAMAEVCDRILQEGASHPELYVMLTRALGVLASSSSPLVVPAFFLKALAVEGVGMAFEACSGCGSPPPLVAFDPSEGGGLCTNCRRGFAVSGGAFDLMAKITNGRLAEALSAPASPQVVAEIRHIASEAVELHLDMRLKSFRLLEGV